MKHKIPTCTQIIKDAMAKRGIKDSYNYVRTSMTPYAYKSIEHTLKTKGVMAARNEAYYLMLNLYPR